MEEKYMTPSYAKLTPDILVPEVWPLTSAYHVILKLIKEIMIQNEHVDPILQVDGIPARIRRYVDKIGFFYVFHKVSEEEIYGSYVYNITLRDNIVDNPNNRSSGTASCTGLGTTDDCACYVNCVITTYQTPSRLSKRKILDINLEAYVGHRSVTRHVKRMCPIPEDHILIEN